MVKYKIEQGGEDLNSTGGISLVGKLLNGLKNLKAIDNMIFGKVKHGRISHSGIIKSMAGLLSLGKSDYTCIEEYSHDNVFRESLGLDAVPSEENLRQRLDEMSGSKLDELCEANTEMLSKVEDFGKLKSPYMEYTPFDADVSPFDNSKSKREGVSWTYKGHDGFAPMFGYVGRFGYMLGCEFREGSQHSNKGALEFFSGCFKEADKLGIENLLSRLDSAHDDAEVIKLHNDNKKFFIIKRNLRKEVPEQWLALAKRVGKCEKPRDGKKVYTGIASHLKPAGREDVGPVFAVFEVTERTIDEKGEPLLIPELEVETFWTNLFEEAETVIELYHEHGTSEQFHSELKSDIGLERMPSGSFATNGLILRIAMMAFNALRIIGQNALQFKELIPIKINVERRRLRSVMQDLIYIACKRVTHSGNVILKFGRNCPWFEVFRQLHLKFTY